MIHGHRARRCPVTCSYIHIFTLVEFPSVSESLHDVMSEIIYEQVQMYWRHLVVEESPEQERRIASLIGCCNDQGYVVSLHIQQVKLCKIRLSTFHLVSKWGWFNTIWKISCCGFSSFAICCEYDSFQVTLQHTL